jgi:hypothetical protein
MSNAHHSLTAFERPRCSGCQAKMALDHVSPGPVGFEHRFFECPKCGHVESVVVASDTFKSKSLGWLSGEPESGSITHDVVDGKLIPRPAV